ncbi:Wzt carbohydrate-binding domain-containing protein, partial [bacterium]|nr:Wzt carbohydrate-binding domain-containing protein [bacterium]
GGMIQGLSKRDIQERFDEIVEFAELAHCIDEPVRTYSSGMFMRLGFSLAIHSDPEVLLIDEVLAVGDEGFVSKCKDKISQLREAGVTLLLVTHDLGSVERWCDEVIWLDSGEVMDRGEPRRVIDAYRQFIEDLEEHSLEELHAQQRATHLKGEEEGDDPLAGSSEEGDSPKEGGDAFERWGSREVEIESVILLKREDGEGWREQFVFHPNEPVLVRIDYHLREKLDEKLVFGIGIDHGDGSQLFGTNTDIERVEAEFRPNGSSQKGQAFCLIPRLSLLSGEHWLDVAVHREDGYAYDYWKRGVRFSVRSSQQQVGKVYLETRWSQQEPD